MDITDKFARALETYVTILSDRHGGIQSGIVFKLQI